ncbi:MULTISPECIES: GNAT family N-acetyltransferase [unclassified Paenibacillus]|uniref:GNAT family N-acetyltransferase n=1 Tax=unclassified Paenibacillus TaxID=185978 RepID=UPI000422B647|nr:MULTISPECIES: GNAT family N-acetyltransferase [unclassified Paenibacillus]
MSTLTAAPESICSPDAEQLISELSAELAALYQVEDGSAGFTPADLDHPRAALVVARIGGIPAGCGALRPLDEHAVEVKRVYTRPVYRRQGVALAIMDELERLAAEFGYRSIRLQTGPLQPEAVALYERSGYYRIPRFHGEWDEVIAFQKDVKVNQAG